MLFVRGFASTIMDFYLFSPQLTNGCLGIGWFFPGFRYSGEFLTTSSSPGAPGAAAGVEDWSTSRCTCASAPCCALYQSSVSSPSSFVSSASVSTTIGNQNTIPPDFVSAFFDRSTTGLLAAAKDLASFRLNNLRRQVVDDFKAVLLSISSPAIESVKGVVNFETQP